MAAAQSAFGGGSDVSDESSSEDEGARASSKPLNAFALLGGDDDDDDDTPEESEEEPEPPPVVKEPTPPPASKKKKKKKKKKTKDDDADEAEADDDDDDDGMAEITAALKEIGETMPAPRPERDALSADASVSGRDALMCVDTRRLKAEDELRSIFGASVIRAVETEDGGNNADANALGHIGRNPRAPGKGGKMQAKLTNARSMLVTPKDGWPPYRAKGTGLAMECVDAAGFVKTFRIVRTDDFADADAAYKRAVASHDPNNLHDSPAVLAVARRRARGALRCVPLRR